MSYFDEKSHQLGAGDCKAFGIQLVTRYAKAIEMAEMLNFARLVAQQRLHPFVEEVFYDSNACCCTFTLVPSLDPYSDAGEKIRQCALNSISQFDWNGTVHHGSGLFSWEGDDEA